MFFRQLAPEQRTSIRGVTGDGAKWIDSCVHEWCPVAERVVDGVRKRLWNQTRHGGDQVHARRQVRGPEESGHYPLDGVLVRD